MRTNSGESARIGLGDLFRGRHTRASAGHTGIAARTEEILGERVCWPIRVVGCATVGMLANAACSGKASRMTCRLRQTDRRARTNF